MFDIVIRGGTVVDGTGAARRNADVAISGGRIVAIGDIANRGATEIDATDRVVAPGFIDIHTHYDAQLMWDPSATPSVLHGVTTVIGGNCGFGLAPVRRGDGSYLARMLSRVEGMPLAALECGVPFTWESFGDWLDHLDGHLAVNAGFLAGHSTLRRAVMGDRVGEEASREELESLRQLLDTSLRQGALGFSTSLSPTHSDADGRPVPSRFAATEELVALARVVADHEGSVLEMIPMQIAPLDDEAERLMRQMSAAGRRPINWNILKIAADGTGRWEESLARCGFDAASGSDVVALTLPELTPMSISIGQGFLFDSLDGWDDVMALPHDEQMRALRDPSVRDRLRAGAAATAARPAGRVAIIAGFRDLVVAEVSSSEWSHAIGRTLGDIAASEGRHPMDVALDISLADGLSARFACPDLGDDDASWALRAEVWQRDDVVLGGSDAGAHLDVICGATYTTNLLGTGVRERKLLDLEQAVQLLAHIPSRLYGLRGRGVLVPGAAADVVVFDADAVGAAVPTTRHDLPAGAARLHAEARGVDVVLVNGSVVVEGGELTDSRPGTVLRRGHDTATRHPGSWRKTPLPVRAS